MSLRWDRQVQQLYGQHPPSDAAAKLTAVTIVTEVGTFKRFRRPTEMMGYTGFVPSEYSSGGRESERPGETLEYQLDHRRQS
jgi:transposase